MADCSKGGIRLSPETHDHRQWTAEYVGSLAAWMTTTGDGGGWNQRRAGCGRKDGNAPQYLVDCCKSTTDAVSRQQLRSASRHQLIVPRHRRSNFGRRVFTVAGPTAWNSLPDYLRDPSLSEDTFRRLLKTYLFALY